MREREIQDYLFNHPEVLFPNKKIQEKAKEYYIHGKRIDLLFMVEGIRYIVEVKAMPLEREHIGQIVEYYGLMKEYFHEGNLRLILVCQSIPTWRRTFLEELGVQCVELPKIPESYSDTAKLAKHVRTSFGLQSELVSMEKLLRVDDRFTTNDINSATTPRTLALISKIVKDLLLPLRDNFSEYEIVPYRILRKNTPDVDVIYRNESECIIAPYTELGCGWFALRFGFSNDAPPNDVPNVSVIFYSGELHVTVNAELQSSQRVFLERIRANPSKFEKLLAEHRELWLRMYLKYEHQPRFYHWVYADIVPPGSYLAMDILSRYESHTQHFFEERTQWLTRIKQHNRRLTANQAAHLDSRTQSPNCAIRLVRIIGMENEMWNLSYDQQVIRISNEIGRLKTFVDFFVK